MDDAQNIIAVVHRVHNHADGVNVVNLVHRAVLEEHLAVDAVDALDAPFQVDVGDGLGDAVADFLLGALDEGGALARAELQPVFNFMVGDGVEDAQRKILQLLLHGPDAEAVRDGGVDLHVLKGLVPLLLGRHELDGAHVVQAVGELDDDHADVLGHRDQHLAQVLGLLYFARGIRDAAELRDAVGQLGDLVPEFFPDLLQADGGVLHNVVQKPGGHRLRIHAELHEDAGHRDGVRNIRRAGKPFLAPVGAFRKAVGAPDEVHVVLVLALADQLHKVVIRFERPRHFSHRLPGKISGRKAGANPAG